MIYLDNAATTYPKPESVYDRVNDVMRNHGANPGRSGHKMALEAGRIIYESREKIAKFFNIENPMRLAFASNATEALNTGIKGLLKEGDHVITTSMEHNSVLRPLKLLENMGKIGLTILECSEKGELELDDLKKAIRENTKLIVTTHASNVTGTMFPIEKIGAIASKNDIIYMVDAAQTAGVYEIDVQAMNIDILAFAGHKSLLGPQGTGGLYVREGIEICSLKEGGTGSKSESLDQPDMMPDKLESGTPNTPGIAGLAAGIDFIQREGMDNIRKHEEELTKYFMRELGKLEDVKVYGPAIDEERVAVISINVGEEDSSEVAYILDEAFDVGTRPGLHCAPLAHKTIGSFEQGTIRFSIGYFNKKDDIDRALEGIREITRNIW